VDEVVISIHDHVVLGLMIVRRVGGGVGGIMKGEDCRRPPWSLSPSKHVDRIKSTKQSRHPRTHLYSMLQPGHAVCQVDELMREIDVGRRGGGGLGCLREGWGRWWL